MSKLKYIHSFRDQNMRAEIAHGGVGLIKTSRAAEHSVHDRINFIDLTILPPGTSIGVHAHGMSDEEIYVVISGEGEITIEGHIAKVVPGDVIVNPPGGTHGLKNTGGADLSLVVVDVDLN